MVTPQYIVLLPHGFYNNGGSAQFNTLVGRIVESISERSRPHMLGTVFRWISLKYVTLFEPLIFFWFLYRKETGGQYCQFPSLIDVNL